MSGDHDRFLTECGGRGGFRLEWDEAAPELLGLEFLQPALVLGRSATADLVIDDPRISSRHAYLQLIDGRLFAVDLDSRTGLHWNGIPRNRGWIDSTRPVRIGPVVLRGIAGEAVGAFTHSPGPVPTSRRYRSARTLPRVSLTILDLGTAPVRIPLERPVTLVGGSDRCHIRLKRHGASRYVCALVNLPGGVWVVDLLSSQGVSLNGLVRRTARIEDGDLLGLEGLSVRVEYEESRSSTDDHAPERPDVSRSSATPIQPLVARPSASLLTPILQPLLEDGTPETGIATASFGQALMMLVKLLEEVHRDHLDLVRRELVEIRRLSDQLRASAALPKNEGGSPTERLAPAGTPDVSEGNAGSDQGWPVQDFELPDRLDPATIKEVVGKRLAAWESERQSRWQRVLKLLMDP